MILKEFFVLIFDQFEELFTFPQSAIDRFKKELWVNVYTKVPQQLRDFISEKRKTDPNYFSKEETELIFARLDIKNPFAIRSDKLSLLNSLTDTFPTVLKYCYELKPLSWEQAKKAILFPAQLTGSNFESALCVHWRCIKPYSLQLNWRCRFCQTDFTGEIPEIETFQLKLFANMLKNLVIENKLSGKLQTGPWDIKHIFEDQYNNIISKLRPEQQLPARADDGR